MIKRIILGIFLASTFAIHAEPKLGNQIRGVDPKVKAVFNEALNQRIAVIGIGDSNQKFGGKGWSHFMAAALYEQYGCYALPLVKFPGPSGAPAEPLPAAFAQKMFGGWYLPKGQKIKNAWNIGSVFSGSAALNLKSDLEFSVEYGLVGETGGVFRPAVRRNEPPWTPLLQSEKLISTMTVEPEVGALRREVLLLPADSSRTFPIMFSAVKVGGEYVGPFVGGLLTCQDKNMKNGVAYHTLYGGGGQSLYDMLNVFRTFGPQRLANYFRSVRYVLDSKGETCIVMICSGLNDRNESEKSIGPIGGFAGNSPEAYFDNLKGIMVELQQAWKAAGGAQESLFFAFMPSHPVSMPEDQKLAKYRLSAQKLAAESEGQAGCILLTELIDMKEMAEKKIL